MVSKNNQWQHLRAAAQQVPHYGLRKLSVGVASVLLSTTLYMGVSAHADTVTTPSETATPAASLSTSGSSGTETTGDAAGSSVSGLPASSANSVSEVPTSQGAPANSVTTPEKPVDSAVDAKVGSEVPAQPVTPNPSGNKPIDLASTGDRAKLDSSSGAPMLARFMVNNQANDSNVGETQVDKKLILQYVDDAGLPVGYQTIPARTNGPTTITLIPPTGYVLADGESNSLNVNYDFTTVSAPDTSTFIFQLGDQKYDAMDVSMRYIGNEEPLAFKVKRVNTTDPYAADRISVKDVDPNLIKDASGSVNDSTTIYHNISYSDLSDKNGLKYPFNQSNTAIYIDGKANVKAWLDAMGANQKATSNTGNPFDSDWSYLKIATAKYRAGTFDRMLILTSGSGSVTNNTSSPQFIGALVSDSDAAKGFYVWLPVEFNFDTGLFRMFEAADTSSNDYLPDAWNYNYDKDAAYSVNGYETTKLATLTWTIHYVDENGNKLAPDTVVSHDYQRIDSALKTGTFEMGDYKYVDGSVKVTGMNNTGYHIDAPDFKYNQTLNGKLFDTATWQVAALKFDGYHADHDSLAVSDYLTKDPGSLGSTSHDYSGGEFTFHYALNPKTVTINYASDDDNEKVVGTGTVSGKPNTEVTITPNLPSGYMLTPGKDVPSTYTVTDGDNQAVTIHVQKQFVDVSDTNPQAKQTRTITLHYVYAGGPKDGQTAFDDAVLDVYYHRTATFDRATNQTTYGDWTWDQSQGDSSTPGYHVVSGKWTNLPQSWATVTADVPSVKGYYADLGQNDPSNTNHVPANTWVFPTYNNRASAGNGATAYLVGYGYEVGPTHTIKYVPNKTTVTVNYVDDDNNQVNVGSQHWDGTIGQHIELTLTPPANYVLTPGWVNPSSYDFDGVNSSWYTVHVKHATQDVTDQQPKDQVNKIETLTRKHLYGPGPHEGEKFGDPDIIEVPWHRTAMKDLVTNKVSFGAWHVVWDEVKQLSGATKMWGDAEHNWINGGLMANHNGYSYLGVGAKTKAITTDGTVIDHYGFAGWIWIGEQDIEKNPTIVQYYGRDRVNVPVKYVDVDTNQQLTTKWLTGDDYLDGNTITLNKGDLTDWGKAVSNDYQLYAKQTLPTTYKIDTVSNNGNLTPITVYVVQPRTVQFTFADNDSTVNGQHPQVGDAIPVTGITGSTTPVNLMIPVGYKLVEGQQLPTTYTFVKGEQSQVILLTHQHVTVQPDAPKTPSDKLPGNPGKNYPSGVAKDDLTKTVTRKVTIVTPDGKSTVTNQTVTFTRNAAVDEVTGKVTYGSWSENGKHEFATVDVPTVSGYTATGDVPSLAVTPNSQDTNVAINYTANDQTTQVVFVDDDDNGKTVDYQDIHGKTGETQKLTDLPENYELANGQSDTITFTADTPKQVTVHLKHKVITKQLKINVYFVLERLIRYTYNINQGGETYLPWISDDELHSGEYGHGSNYKNIGSVTGSVQYDLVSGEVVKVNNGETFKFDDTILSNYPLDIDVANSGSLTGGSDVINHTFADILNQETHSDLSYKSYASVDLTKDLLANEELLNHLFIHKKNLVPVVFDNGKQHGSDYEINTAKTDSPFLINFNDLFKNNYSDHYDIEKNDDGSLNETAILALPIVYQAYTSKTVTRTINVISPDKTVKTIKQAAEINQNVGLDFDHQYPYLHKGDAYATDNNWTAYTVPTINGYTASQNIVNAVAVNGNTTDQTVNISYTANKQQVNINYVDVNDGNKVVHTTTVNGVTGGDTNVPNELPAGYKLVDGQSVPKTIHFNANNNNDINVKVQHSTVMVTPNSSKTPSDKLPDNPGKSYPSGVSENDLNKTVTRTIKVTTPNGQTKTVEQTAKLTRTADVDEVTGEVKYSDWTTGQWNTYTPETVSGYSPSISEVPKVTVDGSSSDQTVAVTYTPNMQTVVITFMDQRGNKIDTPVTVSGRIGETVKVNDQVPDGWKLYAGQAVPKTITLSLGTTKYDFVINHLQSFVSFDQPKCTTDLVAGTRDIYYPSGLSKNDLTKTITRTIKDGDQVVKTQSVTFVRNAVVDVVTGEVTYLNWSYDGEYLLAAYVPTPRNGYTVDLVKSLVVTPDSESSVVDLNYQPVVKTVTVNYVDASGKVIQSVTGVTKLTAPTGYRLMTSDTINVDDSAVNTYNVLVEPVRKTYTFHDQLPANVKDLSKVVTRTVKIEMPNGHVRTIKQEVRFERTATVDANGTVTYSDYHVIGRNSFNKVFIPHRFGYKLIFSDGSNSVAKIGNVNADAGDTTIVVKYVK